MTVKCLVVGEATLHIGGVKRQLHAVCLLESVLVGLSLSLYLSLCLYAATYIVANLV